MTTRAEKLARELIALSEQYTCKDFERASELLLSGELFRQTVTAAQIARNIVGVAAERKGTTQPRLPLRDAARSRPKRQAMTQLTTDEAKKLLNVFEEHERATVSLFMDQFLKRNILASGSAIRTFAAQIGCHVPSKLPPRLNLLRTLLRQLADVPVESRAALFNEAVRIETGESSLQRWSDLIVKSAR